jgi:hypothetical protein
MTEPSTWMVDQLAAAKADKELNLGMSQIQLQHLAEIFAEHRSSTLDLGIARVETRISESIEGVLKRNYHKSGEWSDGCRSAEATVLTTISCVIQEMKPVKHRSKGQILRSLMRQGRQQKAASEPVFERIEVPIIKALSQRS